MRTHALSLFAVLALLTGCGGLNLSTGELGNLNYSLHSDFVVDQLDLTQVSILAGHPQSFGASLTDQGEDRFPDTEDDATWSHEVTPSAGVTVSGSDDVPSFALTVTDPGEYVVESSADGELVDRITLTFDVPTELDGVTWVRPPNADDFDKVEATTAQVDEGAQAAFVPIPLDADGDRIVGDFVPVISADPAESVVSGLNVLGIYEQNVVVARSPASVYFIEPGAITVSVSDEVNGLSFDQAFSVAPVAAPGS